MPYTPTAWVNGSAPALSATNLNNIETGISNSINKDGSVAMTAQFVTVAGSATTPSIAPTGDTNTGIFFPSADTIAFVEGGAEVMRILSTGNISVGTTSSIGKFTVGGSSTFILCESDETRRNQLICNADSTGTILNSTFNTGGSAIFRIQTANVERVKIDSTGFQVSVLGTQSAPSIALTTDTNTGIYWASADKLAITEGGRGLTFDEFKMSLCMGAMI